MPRLLFVTLVCRWEGDLSSISGAHCEFVLVHHNGMHTLGPRVSAVSVDSRQGLWIRP